MQNKKDLFGNAKGGIRTPGIDYPVGTYYSYSTKADGSYQQMFGRCVPFSADKLRALYGDLEHYQALVEKGANELISLGFLLPEDREEMIALTVSLASKRGLRSRRKIWKKNY